MKQFLLPIFLVSIFACNTPQQQSTPPQDTIAAPGVVRPEKDSDRYKMPVQKADTSHDQQMPVAMPDGSVQPK